jgi:hypothetical protein
MLVKLWMPLSRLGNQPPKPYRRVAQGLESLAYIQFAVGSNPTPPTISNDREDSIDLASWKDRKLWVVELTEKLTGFYPVHHGGSNPSRPAILGLW